MQEKFFFSALWLWFLFLLFVLFVQLRLHGLIPCGCFFNELRAGCRGRQSSVRPRKGSGAVQFSSSPVLRCSGQLSSSGACPQNWPVKEDLGDHTARNGNASRSWDPQADAGHQQQAVGAEGLDPEARTVPDEVPRSDVSCKPTLLMYRTSKNSPCKAPDALLIKSGMHPAGSGRWSRLWAPHHAACQVIVGRPHYRICPSGQGGAAAKGL